MQNPREGLQVFQILVDSPAEDLISHLPGTD
jgi:hypothetical protein